MEYGSANSESWHNNIHDAYTDATFARWRERLRERKAAARWHFAGTAFAEAKAACGIVPP